MPIFAEPIDDPDALWVHELIGSRSSRSTGTDAGRCVAVVDNPAADLLELDSGALVPVVFVVGHADGVVVIDPPEGLFDVDRDDAVRIDVFTIFPGVVDAFCSASLLGKARASGLLDLRCHDPRDHTSDVHRTVDDAPFGGGAGMLMRPEPIFAAVEAADAAAPAVPARAGRSPVRPGGGAPSWPAATGSACCAGATRGSTTASASTSSTASSASATSCCPAARSPPAS